MAEFKSVLKELKNNKYVNIRSAKIEDAEQILFVSKSVIDEEVFQLTSSNEFNITVVQE